MKRYIDIAILVAEIKRIEHETNYEPFTDEVLGKICTCRSLLSFLDSLGTKEVKESSAADRGMAEEVIVNLRRIEQDYHIDLTKEMEWVRSKVQKGE